MEIKNKLFFFVGIAVFVGCILSCNQPEKKEKNNPIHQRNFTFNPVSVTIDIDRLVPIELVTKKSLNVLSPKTGRLNKGDVQLKFGEFVRKGDLLAQLSFDEEYKQLVELKKKLFVEVTDFIETPNIQSSNDLRTKWTSLAEELSPAKRLPPFPLIDSEEEKQALKQTMIGKYYVQAAGLERSIDGAFVFSPKTGWLNKVDVSIGNDVNQGQLIAEVAESKDWYVKNKSSLDELKGEKWSIIVNRNKEIGKLVRGKRSTYSIQFTLGIILPPDKKFFISAKQSIQAQRIPRTCFKNETVWTIQNGQENRVVVKRIKQSVDSVWVIGLPKKCVLIQF